MLVFELARQKAENGMCGFLTQPVLTDAALENLRLARETLDARLLGGIIPIVSHRNAVYLNTEVAGIRLDPGLFLSAGALNALRRDALTQLEAALLPPPKPIAPAPSLAWSSPEGSPGSAAEKALMAACTKASGE